MYVWVSGGSGAESVTFDNEWFGDVGEIRRHVWDVALGLGECSILRRSSEFCGTETHPCCRTSELVK